MAKPSSPSSSASSPVAHASSQFPVRSIADTTSQAAITATVSDDEALIAIRLRRSRRREHLRSAAVTTLLLVLLVALAYVDLAFGHELYSFSDIVSVAEAKLAGGDPVPGLSFVIAELRAPRVAVGALCGLAFGLAGATFQHILRNIMASPDIIGITAGANTAAAFGIVVLGLSGLRLSAFALIGGLATAALVIALAWEGGTPSIGKLILMGIGLAAALNAVSSWILIRADQWDMQSAQRWLTGSLADAAWPQVAPIAVVVIVAGLALTALNPHVDMLRFGPKLATGLGVRVARTQIAAMLLAVVLLSAATATSGPIAFVAFLSGPIAARLAGPGKPAIGRAGIVGACLVLASDIVAQHLPQAHVPVGVVTSLIGGPILVILMIRMARGKKV
ncbi:iron chelate uptake ABC transporter family permease subunit [Bifidobacterium sp. ESL0763]|uniref:FecCD family ABC transporter permease n=1 Tax=Bifidobacterium sp. ESL0763 TaxID=2983227 RepID=UPI0023F88462|nr:iron chelate uptake ABC transporter family permease subunit [Bifidobacterium sp. ESL0763]MDF7664493.1 iron chelate uptake ABC transporter family permease subunit [Bifidobacterium sp. ESL0763]